MNRRGRLIIITTHYMDEASRCDAVGFMRRGRLIAEGTPEALKAARGTFLARRTPFSLRARGDGDAR